MQKRMYHLAVCCFCLLMAFGLNAQSLDVIRLQSGKKVVGVITAYKSNEYVVIRKAKDNLLTRYMMEAVASITQRNSETEGEAGLPFLVKPDIASRLELLDGTIYEGEVLSYEENGEIRFMLTNGSTLTFDEAQIGTITYNVPEDFFVNKIKEAKVLAEVERVTHKLPKPPYEFRERGIFNSTSFAFSFGAREISDDEFIDPFFGPTSRTSSRSAIGFNVQHIMGYQFKRKMGLGLGASYDAYDLEDGEAILSLFAHYRGYLLEKNVSPFWALNAGYGFALRNENQGVTEARGGWMVHPEIGLRLGAAPKANFTIALGYRLQDAYYVQEFPFNGNIEYRDLVYRRMLFSLGLTF